MQRCITLCFLALLSAVLTSCVSATVHKLPRFDELSGQPALSHPPKLLFVEDVPPSDFPALVPYAVIGALAGEGSKNLAARAIWRKASAINADVVIVESAGTVYGGSVSQYVGYGAAVSTPVYEHMYRGTCFKLAPFRLGLTFNSKAMVVTASDEARQAGVLEGDTLLAVSGLAVELEGPAMSPHLDMYRRHKAGDEIELVWIRPGVGRMSGKLRALSNDGSYLDVPSSVDWDLPSPTADRSR